MKFSQGTFDDELQQCFLNTLGKDMEVDSDYKEYVLNQAQIGVIYVSAKASSAADVYIKAINCYLGFQFKWGKEPFGHKDLISEITSAILSPDMPFVFVIVAQHLTNQFLSNQDGCPVLRDKEKHELGIIYNHTGKNSTIERYTIPPHVQVIILFNEGINYLVGNINYRVIKGEDPFLVALSGSFQLPNEFLLTTNI